MNAQRLYTSKDDLIGSTLRGNVRQLPKEPVIDCTSNRQWDRAIAGSTLYTLHTRTHTQSIFAAPVDFREGSPEPAE